MPIFHKFSGDVFVCISQTNLSDLYHMDYKWNGYKNVQAWGDSHVATAIKTFATSLFTLLIVLNAKSQIPLR